ncbi:MAG: Alpha-L-arabinofuranosidase precursor [Rhodospirillales bacterium]|nr:Alpha-L-arabinofuranosidase precursor [Rhodospirillales bacterium]
MKKLVWSSTRVEGGTRFRGVLAQPPVNTGPIQNAPMTGSILGPRPKSSSLSFYRDSVVVAYKSPVAAPEIASVTASASKLDAAKLGDGDVANGVTLTPPAESKEVWVEIAYAQPTLVQGLTMAVSASGAPGVTAHLAVSDDEKTWRTIAEIPAAKLALHTVSFAPAKGRFFRITLSPAPPTPLPGIFTNYAPGASVDKLLAMMAGLAAPLSYQLQELVLHPAATVHEAEAKAGFAIAPDYYAIATKPDAAPGTAVDASNVVILTDRMQPDGTLDWTPPPGSWVVLRLGYSLVGKENHPAPPEATGLEVDKLNRDHVRDYLNRYLALYETALGPRLFGKRGVNALTIDSTEIGAQNWTENILTDFERLRAYDPSPWLPVLTGVVVGGPQESDRFLWDFRRTVAELLAVNHYAEIAAAAHARGLVNYAEALEDHRASFGDDMEMRRYADLPMAAMWMYGTRRDSYPTYVADIRGAASVAHIYGQNLVAAESLTSAVQPWAYGPRQLKPVIDLEFAHGVNRIVMHTSVHQPVERPPGLSLFVFGQFMNRLESWADDARPWIDYIARSSYLLQQGRYVADVAYFYGEEAPLTGVFGEKEIDVPQGHGFDFVNAGVILDRLSVDKGELVTPSGMRYRVLYLGGTSRYMTLPVLRKIRDLVAQGAVVVGARPLSSPSLADDDARFQAVADELFGKAQHGAGRVFAHATLAEAFASLDLPPDFAYSKPDADTELLALHRMLERGDIYFVSNRRDRAEAVTATFRVRGMAPELWNAVTGEITPADFRMTEAGTAVALKLGAYESRFVVFREPTDAPSRTVAKAAETDLATLSGPWTLSFQGDRGAPKQLVQDELASWSDSPIPGVRYFSGSATYTKSFALPPDAYRNRGRIVLDLGDVRDVAEIRLNGRTLATLWMPPFEIDATSAIRSGQNLLEVKVANLWVNRLIGDAQPGVTKKYTFTTIPTYNADAPLRLSGLLGPVRIRQVAVP